jgi:hypothetical protein
MGSRGGGVNPQKQAETAKQLESMGFKQSNTGGVAAPNGDKIYTKVTDFTPDTPKTNSSDENDMRGHITHTIAVHPDGSWEHTSEGVHEGFDLETLKRLNLSGWEK